MLGWKTGLLFRKSLITSPPPERDGGETCEVQFLTIPLRNILKGTALSDRKLVVIFFPSRILFYILKKFRLELGVLLLLVGLCYQYLKLMVTVIKFKFGLRNCIFFSMNEIVN